MDNVEGVYRKEGWEHMGLNAELDEEDLLFAGYIRQREGKILI